MGLFIERRPIWWPTLTGWLLLAALLISPCLSWWFGGEGFLATTHRQPAEVLVVEGWIGLEGVRAAKTEFEQGNYRWLVAVGASTNNRWGRRQWNYAELAHDELIRLGLPAHQVIAVPTKDTGRQRTYESALAVRAALREKLPAARAINLLTLDVHTRRSRLVFSKVLAPEVAVGAIAWHPAAYGSGPWWNSSERAGDMIKETVGYFFELLLNSGRLTNHDGTAELPPEAASSAK